MAMQANTAAIERAFELAKSGRYVTLGQIKYSLHVEGYFADAITGTQLCERLAKNAMARRYGEQPLSLACLNQIAGLSCLFVGAEFCSCDSKRKRPPPGQVGTAVTGNTCSLSEDVAGIKPRPHASNHF